ncbi:MAG: hypothetical protein V4526_01110 [Patescibacteria group bacterium]
MKKIIYVIVIVVVFALIFMLIRQYGTDSRPLTETPDGRVRAAEVASVKIGETKEISGLQVTFNKFVQDNRCPVDQENCPEAGGVTLNISLKANEGTTATGNIASDEVPLEFAGYAVSIVKVAPDRKLSQQITDPEYEVSFRVAPLALQNVQENPGI